MGDNFSHSSSENSEINDPILLAFIRGTITRKEREDSFQTDAEKRHIKNIKNNYNAAVVDYLTNFTNQSTERVAYNKTKTTFSLNLNPHIAAPCIELLSSVYDEKPKDILERLQYCGNAAVEEKRDRSKYARAIVPLFFLVICAIYQFRVSISKQILLPVILLICSLFFLLLVLIFSRRSKKSSIMKSVSGTSEELEKYCDVLSETILQSANKPLLAISLLMTAASLVFLVVSSRPPSLEKKIKTEIKASDFANLETTLDDIVLSGPSSDTIEQNTAEALIKVYDEFPQGSFEKYWLAYYANLKMKNGFPKENAKNMLNFQILSLDYSSADTGIKRSFLEKGLGLYKEGPEPVLSRYFQTGSKTDKETAGIIGKQFVSIPLSEKIIKYKKFLEKGFPADSFLSAALRDTDIELMMLQIQAETVTDVVKSLAGIYASKCTTLKDAIPLIYTVRQKGLKLAEVFPDGIEIEMALPLLNPDHLEDDFSEQIQFSTNNNVEHYIVLSRTEKDEPYEEFDTGFAILADYDGHDKNDPTVFTVKLESLWTDAIPMENLPATSEECDFLIVSDMFFYNDGMIRHSSTTTTKSGYTLSNIIKYIPSYARVYRILLVEQSTGVPYYTFSAEIEETEEFNEKSSSYTSNARNKYLATEINDWQLNNLSNFMGELEAAEWDSLILMLNALLSSYENAGSGE